MSPVTAFLDTFLAQNALEKLLTYQGEDAEAEEGEDHHVNKLLHGAQ